MKVHQGHSCAIHLLSCTLLGQPTQCCPGGTWCGSGVVHVDEVKSKASTRILMAVSRVVPGVVQVGDTAIHGGRLRHLRRVSG